MKRTLVITLAFVMVLGVVGCGTKKTDTKPDETPVVKEEVMPVEETNEPTEEVKTNEEEVMPTEETNEPTEEVTEPVEEEVETNEEATNPNPIVEKDNGENVPDNSTKPSNAGGASHVTEYPTVDDGAKVPGTDKTINPDNAIGGGGSFAPVIGGATSEEEFNNYLRDQGCVLPGDPGFNDTPWGN